MQRGEAGGVSRMGRIAGPDIPKGRYGECFAEATDIGKNCIERKKEKKDKGKEHQEKRGLCDTWGGWSCCHEVPSKGKDRLAIEL